MAEASATMPFDVGTISTTTSLTTNDDVTSSSLDVVIEKSPSSNANEVSLVVDKEAVDSVNMETASSSDLPREVIDSATEETSHSKMKLQRQDAVAEEKDEIPVVSSQPLQKMDYITTSLSRLIIGNVLYVCVASHNVLSQAWIFCNQLPIKLYTHKYIRSYRTHVECIVAITSVIQTVVAMQG